MTYMGKITKKEIVWWQIHKCMGRKVTKDSDF